VVTAGPDIVTCSSDIDAALSGVVTGPTTTGEWSTLGSGSFSPSEFDLITDYLISPADTTAGTVILTLTSTNNGNCLAESSSLTLTILDKPVVDITTADSLCANVPLIDLTGTVTTGYSTIWSIPSGGGTIVDPNALITTYNIVPADTVGGSIYIYFETSGGICPVEKDSLELMFVAPPVVFAGLDQSFCDNELSALNGTLSGTATGASWSTLGTGTFNPSNNLLITFYEPSPLDLTNGSVDLILTSSADFGCLADKDTMTVTYLDVPVADFTFSSECLGDNTNFFDQSTTTDGTINTWDYDFGDGTTGSIAANPVHGYASSGNFFVTLIAGSTNGCYDTIVKSVNVNPVPIAMYSNNYACENEAVEFIDNSFLAAGNILNWDWDFNSGQGNSNIQNPSFVFGVEGTYSVLLTVTSDSGCVGTITQDVSVLGGPTADFGVNPVPALALEDVFFTDSSSGGPFTAWFWDFGDGIGGNNQDEIHEYANGGFYNITLTVTDTAGCTDTTFKSIQIILEPALPTAFTPNGDGENDIYLIRGGPFQAVDFKVFNNWGQLVFSTDQIDEGWDGTFNGTDAPIGVYSWTYNVIMIGGGPPFIEKGDVTLMR